MKIKLEQLLLGFIFLVCLLFNPDTSLDLFRYFEDARNANLELSISEYAQHVHERQFDFIYPTTLFCCHKYNIPLNLVNSLFVVLYFYAARKLVKTYTTNIYESRIDSMLATLVLFAVIPFVYIFSISRMVASFSFLFLALCGWRKKRYLKFLVLTTLTIFTHVGSTIYILIFICFSILSKFIKISHKKLAIIGGILIPLGGMYLLKLIVDIATSFSFFGVYSYFLTYLQEFNGVSFEGQSMITMLASFWALAVYGIFIIVSDSKYDSIFLTCLFLVLVFSIALNNMFFQRTLLFSLPFISIATLNVPVKYILIKKMVVLSTLLISLLTYLAYYKNFINLF